MQKLLVLFAGFAVFAAMTGCGPKDTQAQVDQAESDRARLVQIDRDLLRTYDVAIASGYIHPGRFVDSELRDIKSQLAEFVSRGNRIVTISERGDVQVVSVKTIVSVRVYVANARSMLETIKSYQDNNVLSPSVRPHITPEQRHYDRMHQAEIPSKDDNA